MFAFGKCAVLSTTAFYLMNNKYDYYEFPVLNHMAWLAFHITTGVTLASAFFLLSKSRGGSLQQVIKR
jgi:hypothetical protein